MTSIPEENGNVPANSDAGAQTATKKARSAPRKPNAAPKKGKSVKKASGPKKAAKGRKTVSGGSRAGSKTEKIVELLKRSGGATLKDLMKATGWQAHSVRGFISGTLGKKMGLTVASVKDDNGERTYLLKR